MVEVVTYKIFENATSCIEKHQKPDKLSFSGVEWKNFQEFKEHFPQNKIILYGCNKEGENILQYCARMKEPQAVEYLLNALANIAEPDKTYITEYFVNNQSEVGRRDTVLTDIALYCSESLDDFLKFNPDPSITNQGGNITLNEVDDLNVYTKIFNYTQQKKPDALLNTNTRGRNSLMMAAYNKTNEHVKLTLTNQGVKSRILQGSYSGYNVLHYAGFNGSVNIFQYLIKDMKESGITDDKIGDSIKQLSCFHRTMLHESAQHGFYGNCDMVKHLIGSYGHYPTNQERQDSTSPSDLFDPRVRDERGYNALHYACVKSDRHLLAEELYSKQPLIEHLSQYINVNGPAIGIQSSVWLFQYNKDCELNQQITNTEKEIGRLKSCIGRNSKNENINEMIKVKSQTLQNFKNKRGESSKKRIGDYPKCATIKNQIELIVKKFKELSPDDLVLDVLNAPNKKDEIEKQVQGWYKEHYILDTPLSIAIMFGNVEGVEFLINNGALFDITALMALDKIKNPEEKNHDRYAGVKGALSPDIENDILQIIKNTQIIFCNIDLEKYFATMTIKKPREDTQEEEMLKTPEEERPTTSIACNPSLTNPTLMKGDISEWDPNRHVEVKNNTTRVKSIKWCISIFSCLCISAIIMLPIMIKCNLAKRVENAVMLSFSVLFVSFFVSCVVTFYLLPDRYLSCCTQEEVVGTHGRDYEYRPISTDGDSSSAIY